MTNAAPSPRSRRVPKRAWWVGAVQRLESAALVAMQWFLEALPRAVALSVGAMIGRLAWWLRLRRRDVLDHIGQTFPDASPRDHRRLAARAAANFGRTVCEFLRFADADRERVSELVRLDGVDELEQALAEGRGAVVVTGHLGAWALYVTALAAAGLPTALMVGVQRNPKVQELILEIPGDAVDFIPKTKGRLAPRTLVRALRSNKVIVLVADHYSADQTLYLPFLGRDAYTMPLPAALTTKHALPLFCMMGHRVDDGRHEVSLRRVPVAADAAGDEAVRAVAMRINEALGAAILRHPEQYFWYHRRWKVRGKKRHAPSPSARHEPVAGSRSPSL